LAIKLRQPNQALVHWLKNGKVSFFILRANHINSSNLAKPKMQEQFPKQDQYQQQQFMPQSYGIQQNYPNQQLQTPSGNGTTQTSGMGYQAPQNPQSQYQQQPQQSVVTPTQVQMVTEPVDAPETKKSKKARRRKIKIEYIKDKSKRHITFSKRKGGIMKKVYELSTLTGTQALLLVASETGHVYTFATPKLQPLITKIEGKNLIQACLNAPDHPQEEDEDEGEPIIGEMKQQPITIPQQVQQQMQQQMHPSQQQMHPSQQQMQQMYNQQMNSQQMNQYQAPQVMRINVSQNQPTMQIPQMNIHQYNPRDDL
jgi:hypothetical protein